MQCPNPKCKGKETSEPVCPTCGLPLTGLTVYQPYLLYIPAILAGLIWLIILATLINGLAYPPMVIPGPFTFTSIVILCFLLVPYKLRSRDVLVIMKSDSKALGDHIRIMPTAWKKPVIEFYTSDIQTINARDINAMLIGPKREPFRNFHLTLKSGEKISIVIARFKDRKQVKDYFISLTNKMTPTDLDNTEFMAKE